MRAVDVTSGSGFTERLVAKGASVLATEAPSTLVVEDVSGNSQRFVVPPTPLVDAHADLVLQIINIARALPAPSTEPSRGGPRRTARGPARRSTVFFGQHSPSRNERNESLG